MSQNSRSQGQQPGAQARCDPREDHGKRHGAGEIKISVFHGFSSLPTQQERVSGPFEFLAFLDRTAQGSQNGGSGL